MPTALRGHFNGEGDMSMLVNVQQLATRLQDEPNILVRAVMDDPVTKTSDSRCHGVAKLCGYRLRRRGQ